VCPCLLLITQREELIGEQRSHAAIVTLAADDPLVKEQETSLEKQHAWFTLHLAHDANTVVSLRLLDTGAAKDVSGVIRITRGGGMSHVDGHEYLYHVGGDGGVRVFERGQ
jgi:elongator complex protein 6